MWHGAQLAIDATIVSPLTRPAPHGLARTPALQPWQPPCRTQPDANSAIPRTPRRQARAARRKRDRSRRASVLKRPPSCASWRSTAQRGVAAPLRAAACAGWVQRWSGMLAVAAMRAYAASQLLSAGEACIAGEARELHEVLADVRGSLPLTCSRLPGQPHAWREAHREDSWPQS